VKVTTTACCNGRPAVWAGSTPSTLRRARRKSQAKECAPRLGERGHAGGAVGRGRREGGVCQMGRLSPW
jgi:hypothetical protein